ncbi:MAG: hypothetical protein PHV82_00840 [Victivallaceae bacterium]|nr:hypothetical protein [Victivallaceae bacterium]
MNDTSHITITRNPSQAVASVVKLFGFRVRGNTVYVFFSGLVAGVLCAIAAYPIHILFAGIMMIVPPVLSVVFIRRFVADKPRAFFWFYLDEKLQGIFLRKPKRQGGNYAPAS